MTEVREYGLCYGRPPIVTMITDEEVVKRMGKFIVFDGIDGVGKTEQCKLATSYIFGLSKENDVFLTREPTKDAKDIREEMVKAGKDPKEGGAFYVTQFVCDRQRHLSDYIIPALRRGVHVVCDRYKYSTLAYQSQQDIDMEYIRDMHVGMQVPDLVIILDCPVEIAQKRRFESKEHATTVYDKASKSIIEEYRKVYLNLPLFFKDEPIHIIDGSKSKEEVAKEIQEKLDHLFATKPPL